MTLEDLVGEHLFSGVAYGNDANGAGTFSFTIDGAIFTAVEDENDGYRSAMDELRSGGNIDTSFPAIKIFASMSSNPNEDILEFRDMGNGKVVLRVGTDNEDNYYPCFISEYTPENMSVERRRW